MTKKLKVSIKRSERIIVRQTGLQSLFCDLCLEETEMLSLQKTALILQTSERQAAKLLESGAFHFTETAEGFLLICRNSIESQES